MSGNGCKGRILTGQKGIKNIFENCVEIVYKNVSENLLS